MCCTDCFRRAVKAPLRSSGRRDWDVICATIAATGASVRGLTTAAIIWLTAAVGMACGAGLPLLALFVTAAHFLVVYAYGPLAHRILSERAELQVQYTPGKGAVEKIMQMCTGRGYAIQELAQLAQLDLDSSVYCTQVLSALQSG